MALNERGLAVLLQGIDSEKPVVMVNLLRFKQPHGRGKYDEYSRAMAPLLARCGATVTYAGAKQALLLGSQAAGDWDMVLLVQYPSPKSFAAMISTDEYRTISKLRSAALDQSVLLATRQIPQGKHKL